MVGFLKFFLVAWITFSLILPARATTLVVCENCELSSIADAIEISSANDTLLIKKGHYRESNLLIDKPLTIIGEDYPIIDGEDLGEIIRVTANNVTLDGLFIINVGTSYTSDFAAIRMVKSRNFIIKNIVLEKLFFGIYLEKCNNGHVYHNKIIGDAMDEYNSGNGIQLWHSRNIVIEKNTVQKVRDGIYLEFSDSILIKDNTSENNLRYGLHFMFSNDDIYENNFFKNNGAGVAVMFSKRIIMRENIFIENWGTASFGLLLKEINDAEISHNTFSQNTVGINIEGSNRIVFANNTFDRNGYALKVLGACYTNSFLKNDFIFNTFDVSYFGKLNDNTFSNNYWSSYTGYDLNKDGIGDIPYRPVKLFSYIVNKNPEAIVLMRSLFIDIIDFSEKVSPVFTPDNLFDNEPKMKKNQ